VQQKIRVFIYCCNRLLGQSVGHILAKRPEFRVATALFPVETAVEGLCQTSNVIVLDSLQSLNSLRQQFARLECDSGSVRSILISMEDNREQFLRAIRAGASGYVLQDASAMDVVAAIRAVAQGEAVCPSRMTRALFDYVAKNSARRHASSTPEKTLTRREQELVPLIGNGLTNKEIAARLNLSEETIKSHIHRILRKVGAEDRRGVFEACQTSDLEM
jgi:DNA-binding NarL/FixJ family response regulator